MSETEGETIETPSGTEQAQAGADVQPVAQAEENGEPRRKPNILTPSSQEARELEQFIDRGHRSVHTVRLMTFFGIIVLLGALFYWEKVDLYPVAPGVWQNFGKEYLPTVVKNQNRKEANAYRLRSTVEVPPAPPFWPNEMYRKLRMDIYILGGAIFILCWIVIKIEGAKYVRNDLLAFRALAREIEKLRLRVREVENSCGKNSKPVEKNSGDDNA